MLEWLHDFYDDDADADTNADDDDGNGTHVFYSSMFAIFGRILAAAGDENDPHHDDYGSAPASVDDYYDDAYHNDTGTEKYNDDYSFDKDDYKTDESKILYLDYHSVLSYGTTTLYLILFVELIRHSIDYCSRGRPFFTAVLLMVYSELATLGIVEFALFLWGKYGSIPKEMKSKFALVHFALFFTALFNAFQYSITSIVSTRVSHRRWVQTEQLQLDHYVEIREEFDRVDTLVNSLHTNCYKWVRNIILFVTKPGLRSRHDSLLIQVRFHELRLHLIESNKLPQGFKVSEYLKKSELTILMGLVHVTASAWVILIAGLNVLYYVTGIIGYTIHSAQIIATVLKGVIFGIPIFFILVSLLLRWKMDRIFKTVIKLKIIDTSDWETGIKRQERLFWWGSPRIVITMIQCMNFGFAVCFSVVIIYSKHIRQDDTLWVYIGATILCYIIFLYNLSHLLWEYTLCTSVAYLVNRKELQQTVAMHRLKEAERQQQKRIVEKAFVNDTGLVRTESTATVATAENIGSKTVRIRPKYTMSHSVADLVNIDTKDLRRMQASWKNIPNREEKIRQRRQNRKSVSDGVAFMRSMNYADTRSTISGNSSLTVADLVKVDTKDLRGSISIEDVNRIESREEQVQQRRRNRKKSISDGVTFMRSMGDFNNNNKLSDSEEKRKAEKRNTIRHHRRKKSLSQPEVNRGWQSIFPSEQLETSVSTRPFSARNSTRITFEANNVDTTRQDILLKRNEQQPNTDSEKDTAQQIGKQIPEWENDRANRLAARRRARKKTQSDSIVIESWRVGSEDKTYNSSDLRGLSSDEGGSIELRINRGKICHKRFSIQDELDLHTLRETDELNESVTFHDSDKLSDIPGCDVNDKGDEQKSTNDDDTIDTNKSEGNLSDIDCVEAEAVGIQNFSQRESKTQNIIVFKYDVLLETMVRRMRLYFDSQQYQNISHGLGTNLIFFIMGLRIQYFLSLTDLKNFDTLKIPIIFFWGEVFLLACFLVADFSILLLFLLRKHKTKSERILVYSSTLDIIIVGVVLALLLVAESARCCIVPTRNYRNFNEIGHDHEFETDCTCPPWGLRTYNGLAMLEPFTSLILLRLFRFYLVSKLVTFNLRQDEHSCKIDNTINLDDEGIHNNDDKYQYGEHGAHNDIHGNAVAAHELWERAISEFPDIVEKYGYFSGELLQAMLGLKVFIDESSGHIISDLKIAPSGQSENIQLSSKRMFRSHIKLSGTRFAKLSLRAQGIIIAGRLGHPVRPMEKTLPLSPHPGLIEFEVDTEAMVTEQTKSYQFVAPFARLVRCIRRCDRQKLPLLKEWLPVDVVMTQFEIVCFEVIDNVNSNLDEVTKSDFDACQLALKATKGGKSLRLIDVAMGRKVVGRLDFCDITEVHICLDDAPVTDMSIIEKSAASQTSANDLSIENWSDICNKADSKTTYARCVRWMLIQEDRLKISTDSGTIFFRFYSDLAYFEAEKVGNAQEGSQRITKNVAFQWAKTISRICGREQLQQDLPHFGENNENELRDYVQVTHFHARETTARTSRFFKGAHRRMASCEAAIDVADVKCKSRTRQVQSMVETGSFEIGAGKNKPGHRRLLVSFGGTRSTSTKDELYPTIDGIEKSHV